MAWGQLYTAKNTYQVFNRLDSLFTDIERAADIRLEVEETSKLAYLATKNQANEVRIQKEQAYRNYLSALQRLNLWLVSDKLYTVPDVPTDQLTEMLNINTDSLSTHPLLNVYKQQIEVAEAQIKERRAQFLPQFQGQYGQQKVDGQTGFYTYQIGIQIPLFFAPELGRTQEAKIQREIANENFRQNQFELNARYLSMREEYLKWRNSWTYYREQALPLAKEQRTGSITAYREGAIDYVTFLQNIRDAIRIEISSWDALGNYLNSRYELEYYLQTTN